MEIGFSKAIFDFRMNITKEKKIYDTIAFFLLKINVYVDISNFS